MSSDTMYSFQKEKKGTAMYVIIEYSTNFMDQRRHTLMSQSRLDQP